MSRYMLSVHTRQNAEVREMPEEEMKQSHKALALLEREMESAGAWVFSARLHEADTATVVRVSGESGEEVLTTDGPFAESKDHLAGFYVIEAPDLDAALGWAPVGIPYRVPPEQELPGRLRPVLAVIYLIYTTGLNGPAARGLCDEAIRLARLLRVLMLDEPEVAGLLAVAPTPVVALNRAIAVGEVHGAVAALELVEELGLDDYYAFHATRADLLRRLGRDASAAYRRAAELAPTAAERDFLSRGGRGQNGT